MVIRKAKSADIGSISEIYERTHDAEERGDTTIGWVRGIYPTEKTAADALALGHLYVMEENGAIVASAKINDIQEKQYASCQWQHDAPDDKVLVLHTLVVDPAHRGKGYGTAFIDYYEKLAIELGRPFLRIDTNRRNSSARRLYGRLGYSEAGIVDCSFNGIPGVMLVCLEKKL